ncbi:MAG: acyl-phosphate glycerol 3-phosphate acyltransferase [Alphaproteobacteria bacterium CG_4_10_14_0_8_um_filter_37_21]|nr:MAG: acyl-phosphate glycerol 3-phosphate acyltransferase [Alphaproteobacteria bacterium CG_4_10_14_0_8_um_filter_37_21]
MSLVQIFSYLLVTYLIAAVPFGLVFGKFLKKDDLRQTGSNNIGATNAWRTGGKILGGLTLLADLLKGFGFVFFAPSYLMPEIVAIVAVVGHIFSIWIGFKGGKGVATALGALLGVYPIAALCSLVVWGAMIKLTKISSLSALLAFLTLPLFGYIFYSHFTFFLVMSLVIFFTHIPNIKRLIKGSEQSISKTESS